jgi:hypothetical protein
MPNIADSPAVTLPLLPTDRLYGERDGVAVKEFAMGDIVALAQQGAATPAQIAAAVTAHESAPDPHPAYMTPAEAALAHAPLAHTHTAAQISDAGAAGRTLLQMATLAEIQSSVSGAGAPTAEWAVSSYTHYRAMWSTLKPPVKTPTVYFDPGFVGSSAGTISAPWATAAQVSAAISGVLTADVVLGIKRGSVLYDQLTINATGSTTGKLYIQPYGSGAAPVIDGRALGVTWAPYSGNAAIWQSSSTPEISDVWLARAGGNADRLHQVTGADLTAKIAALAAYIASPLLHTSGASTHHAGVTYAYFRDTNANPNVSAVVASKDFGLRIPYTIAAGCGNIYVSGIATRYSRDTGIAITASTYDAVSGTMNPIVVFGCRADYCGSGVAAIQGAGSAFDAILVNGQSATVRVGGGIVGCEMYDCINNATEISNTLGFVIAYNSAQVARGNSVSELWSSNSNAKICYNRGVGAVVGNDQTGANYSGSGVWIANYSNVIGALRDNAQSAGNRVYGNYIQDARATGIVMAGQNNIAEHNTIAMMSTSTISGNICLRFNGGATATGNVARSNVCYLGQRVPAYGIYVRHDVTGINLSTPFPAMDRNVYVRSDGTANAQWEFSGTAYYNMAAWRTACGQEANSLSNTGQAMVHDIRPVRTETGNWSILLGPTSAATTLGSAWYVAGDAVDLTGATVLRDTPSPGAFQ